MARVKDIVGSLARRAAAGDLAAAERLVHELRANSRGGSSLERVKEASDMLRDAVLEAAAAARAEVEARMADGQDYRSAEAWAISNAPALEFPGAVLHAGERVGFPGWFVQRGRENGERDVKDAMDDVDRAEQTFVGLMEIEGSRQHGGPFGIGDAVWHYESARRRWLAAKVADLDNDGVDVELTDEEFRRFPMRGGVRMSLLRKRTAGHEPPSEAPR